jgi:hypothetical protein
VFSSSLSSGRKRRGPARRQLGTRTNTYLPIEACDLVGDGTRRAPTQAGDLGIRESFKQGKGHTPFGRGKTECTFGILSFEAEEHVRVGTEAHDTRAEVARRSHLCNFMR